MNAPRPLRVTVVAHGDTVHHRRFARAITGRGHAITTLRWDELSGTPERTADLAAAIAASRPDVVLAGPVPTVGADVVATTDRPVVVASWGSDLLVDARTDGRLATRAGSALSGAAAVLVDCRTVERAAIDLGAHADRVVRFPWGVDLALNEWYPVPPLGGRLRVVSLRSLEPEYRVDVLVAALHAAPEVELRIIGSGSAEGDLRRSAERSGVSDRIDFRGRVDEQETVVALRDAHVHVSTVPVDGSSISLLQSLAVGRPSIVVDNPSNREWIEQGVTGWLTPEGDAVALAEALRAAATDRALLEAMSLRGREIVEREADWSVHARTLCDTLESVAT